jgi:hypothetical protein
LSNDFDTIMPDHPFLPGQTVGNPRWLRAMLPRLDEAKRRYRRTGTRMDHRRLKWLSIACGYAARRSFTEWAQKMLRGKFGLPQSRVDGG